MEKTNESKFPVIKVIVAKSSEQVEIKTNLSLQQLEETINTVSEILEKEGEVNPDFSGLLDFFDNHFRAYVAECFAEDVIFEISRFEKIDNLIVIDCEEKFFKTLYTESENDLTEEGSTPVQKKDKKYFTDAKPGQEVFSEKHGSGKIQYVIGERGKKLIDVKFESGSSWTFNENGTTGAGTEQVLFYSEKEILK